MSRTFLLSWDCLGLEAVINISDIEQEAMWNTLRGDPLPNLDSGIAEQDIRDMFETDPQGSADLVRERGNKVFSDRRNATEVRIV
jgi:hypothetical protein